MQMRLWYPLQWLLWVCQADAVRVTTLVARLSSLCSYARGSTTLYKIHLEAEEFRVWRMQVTVGRKQR